MAKLKRAIPPKFITRANMATISSAAGGGQLKGSDLIFSAGFESQKTKK